MVDRELQLAVESVEPQLTEIAKLRGVTVAELFQEMVIQEYQRDRDERASLKKIVAQAEASGFQEVNLETWAKDMKAEARRRHAAK